MTISLTVQIFGLCLVLEGAAESPHTIIPLNYEERPHTFFVVAPAINIVSEPEGIEGKSRFGFRFFALKEGTKVSIEPPPKGTSGRLDQHGLTEATLGHLGLRNIKTSVLNGESPGLGLLELPSTNSKYGWVKELGTFKFPAESVDGAEPPSRSIADAFIWRGDYTDGQDVKLKFTYADGEPAYLTLKSVQGSDFKIQIGSEPAEEKEGDKGSPFGYWRAYEDATMSHSPDRGDPVNIQLLHVGSSSCPPVKGR